MWCIYTMEYYSAIKKNETMPFSATWMDLEIIILNAVCQTEKDKYHTISFICGVENMKHMNLSMNRNRLKDTEKRLVVSKGVGGGRGMVWEFVFNR